MCFYGDDELVHSTQVRKELYFILILVKRVEVIFHVYNILMKLLIILMGLLLVTHSLWLPPGGFPPPWMKD